jgi:hypothetical protein
MGGGGTSVDICFPAGKVSSTGATVVVEGLLFGRLLGLNPFAAKAANICETFGRLLGRLGLSPARGLLGL